jgi:hypothetical protein
MAGIKGKSGIKKGTTNNPFGKPKGTKNKISASVKSDIVAGVTKNMNEYWERLENPDDEHYIMAMTNLMRLIVPRPLNEEEKNANAVQSEFMKRLFNIES